MSIPDYRNPPAAELEASVKQAILWGFLLAALCPVAARGQSVISWRSSAGGDYAVANNWSPVNVPDTTNESARFALDAKYAVAMVGDTTTDISDW